MKVLLYGLTKYCDCIEKCFSDEVEIVGYSDGYATIDMFNGYRFYSIDKINECIFDYIVITNMEIKTINSIKKMLLSKGIDKNCIISFWQEYNVVHVCKAGRVKLEKVRGIVLGISHAVCGVDTDYMGDFVNLAVRLQDIFYNNKVFEHFIKYNYIGDSLEYLIFDLYDYNYFNFDVSLTRNCFEYYYKVGGVHRRWA